MSKYLTNVKKIPTLDADIYSHEALSVGEQATKEVMNRYGNIVKTKKSGITEINRIALGKLIFTNEKERNWLENLLHPIIIQRIKDDLSKYNNSPVIAIIIPLLYEANLTYLCSETWLVYCTLEQQYERLMHRNKLTFQEAQARINCQITLEKKKFLADKVIDNSNNVESCFEQIDQIL